MFRQIKTVFIAALLMCSAAAHSAAGPDDPPGRVARLNYSTGTVSFAPFEAPDAWMQAVLNRPLTSGDRLWVDQTGRAELHSGSTAVRLGALTSADILNLDDDILQLRLAQGTINVRVRELDADDIVEVATPAGAVLLRQPGSYRITADPSGGFARVLVNFGQAEVVTPLQRYTVPSGQAVTMSAAGGPASFEVAAYAGGDEFDRWSAERDRREDRSTSARYVSRDMTGYQDLDEHGSWRTLPEYGAVWVPTRIAPDWAPFRHGHWAWVSPWGWTWVDDAPWGFAPSHYGRWIQHDNYWAWAPGRMVRRPVYAPAVVAFVGGSNFSVSARSGPAVGWFPLGWREPYIPWYRASHRHVQNVNVTHVTNITHIANTNVRYVHRERPEAVTVVPQQAFVSSRSVAQSSMRVSRSELARADVLRDRQPAEPGRASFAPERASLRPPSTAASREVVSVNAPAAAGSDRPAWRERPAFATGRSEDEPRVRVLRGERAQTQQPARIPTTAVAPAPPSGALERSRPAAAVPPAAIVTTTPRPTDAERAAERREQRQDRREAALERRAPPAEAGQQAIRPPAARLESTQPRMLDNGQARESRNEPAVRSQAEAQARAQAEALRAQQQSQGRAQADQAQAQARAQAEARAQVRAQEREAARRAAAAAPARSTERGPAGPPTGTGSQRLTD